MKRSLLALLLLPLFASIAWGQGAVPAPPTKPLTLKELQQKKADLVKESDDLTAQNAKLMPRINAYKVRSDAYNVDLAAFTLKADAYNGERASITSALAAHVTKMKAHNDNQCHAQRGSSACDWYNTEAKELDAERDEIQRRNVASDANLAVLTPVKEQLDKECSAVNQQKDDLKVDFFPLKDAIDKNTAAQAEVDAAIKALTPKP